MLFLRVASKQDKALKIFTVYLGVMMLIQILTSTLQYLSINNLYLSHFYFILQFLFLSYFYLEILKTDFQKKVVQLTVPIGITVLSIQYYLNQDLFFKFNYFEIFITSFLIIIFAMFHLYNILNEKKVYYYLTIGIFMYLFGSTFLFITGNLLQTLDSNFRNIIWVINSVLYVVYQVYIFIEFKHLFLNKKSQHDD